MSLNFLRNFTSVSYRGVSYKGYGVYYLGHPVHASQFDGESPDDGVAPS